MFSTALLRCPIFRVGWRRRMRKSLFYVFQSREPGVGRGRHGAYLCHRVKVRRPGIFMGRKRLTGELLGNQQDSAGSRMLSTCADARSRSVHGDGTFLGMGLRQRSALEAARLRVRRFSARRPSRTNRYLSTSSLCRVAGVPAPVPRARGCLMRAYVDITESRLLFSWCPGAELTQ
jgi:hypothetical protein